MRYRSLVTLTGFFLVSVLLTALARAEGSHDEFRVWDRDADAAADISAALQRARDANKKVLITFGANWCKDSRALASFYSDPELSALLASEVELVWVEVGMYHRNIDIGDRYGIDYDAGVPAIALLDSDGSLLFASTAGEVASALSKSAYWARGYFADLLEHKP